MSEKDSQISPQLEQGRLLARRLYDFKIRQLEKLNEQDRKTLLADFPLLGKKEYKDVLRQVIEAKKAEQIQVGWSTIPHDITVLVFVVVGVLTDLRTGIVAGIGTLVLFESIFQVYFNRRIYPQLSILVWFTYPAYILLAWVLYTRGLEWYWVALTIAVAWAGTFLFGIIARFPMQLIMRGRAEAEAKHKAQTMGGQK